jgi:hypothetical protein
VCETSFTLREEWSFENKGLKRLFGPKREKVTEEWRKFHNEELHSLYSSLHITVIIKERWTGHVAHMGEIRN